MSSWGNRLKLSLFGESHGPEIGVVLDGLPPGEAIDLEELNQFCARRAPGRSSTATSRREADFPRIQSGLYNGRTTGTPLCAVIANQDTRSGDYQAMQAIARPGHADYTGYLRYQGANDPRGGGHFSGRLTAPLVIAGGIAKQILARQGVEIGAHIASVHTIQDQPFPSVQIPAKLLRAVGQKPFPVLDDAVGDQMIRLIEDAAAQQDSLGGVVACAAVGFPAGIGSPMFDGIENVLASILFGIPAVKGVEFGDGFAAAMQTGSQHNDPFVCEDDQIRTTTNHHGGILGGISSGMPLLLRVAFKPTPSIARPQQTVDFRAKNAQTLSIQGRHDPCIVPRAVPCVEAAVAVGLLSLLLESNKGG